MRKLLPRVKLSRQPDRSKRRRKVAVIVTATGLLTLGAYVTRIFLAVRRSEGIFDDASHGDDDALRGDEQQ